MTQLIHEQTVTSATSQLASANSPRSGDHERLFRLLEETGPAPVEFMLHLSDPMIERENIFEAEDEA